MFYGKVRATKISEASLRIVSDEFSNSMETSISASHLTSSKREVANSVLQLAWLCSSEY
jgi:hypothetical protein